MTFYQCRDVAVLRPGQETPGADAPTGRAPDSPRRAGLSVSLRGFLRRLAHPIGPGRSISREREIALLQEIGGDVISPWARPFPPRSPLRTSPHCSTASPVTTS